MTKSEIRTRVERLFGHVPKLTVRDDGSDGRTEEPYVIDVDLGLNLHRTYDGHAIGTGSTWDDALDDLMANTRIAVRQYSDKLVALQDELNAYRRLEDVVLAAATTFLKTQTDAAFAEEYFRGTGGKATPVTGEEMIRDATTGSGDTPVADRTVAVPPAEDATDASKRQL